MSAKQRILWNKNEEIKINLLSVLREEAVAADMRIKM
jgi:hypothetical protein